MTQIWSFAYLTLNIVGLLSDNGGPYQHLTLNDMGRFPHIGGNCLTNDNVNVPGDTQNSSKPMKPFAKTLFAALVALIAAGPVHASCYADYRAKMDNPFRLHYGVIELPDNACSVSAASPVISNRISSGGWELLQVVSVFQQDQLASRRADAGAYFLRF